MKVTKKLLTATMLLALTSQSWAYWETCKNRGGVIADGGTKLVQSYQNPSTWDDWTWRGKWDGTVFNCSSNSNGCSFNWNTTKYTEYSHMISWTVGVGGFAIPFIGGEVQGSFTRQKTWTEGQSEAFTTVTNISRGQWAQPVIVVVRRYRLGHFNGGHFKMRGPNADGSYPAASKAIGGCKPFRYNWAWRDYGEWKGSEKEWGYKLVHVTNSANDL